MPVIGGRYTLERELGRGGMGSVWLGHDQVLGRDVAMKRVGVAPGGSSPDLLRAEREARIAASLNHPHVVGVFDLVQDDDTQYLVMEYIEGATLSEIVRDEGPLDRARAASILGQVASALAAAHAAGIVHRDVKPSNILVRADGQAKLSDFGIARAQADASLTQTGLVTGSPAYLAPEVASGKQATPAADVWSLGATSFHALTGRPPYEVGDNVLGALYRIVNDPPPRLPDAGRLSTLIEVTMVSDPAARWAMADVARLLDEDVVVPDLPVAGATASLLDLGAAPLLAVDRDTGGVGAGGRRRGDGRALPVLVLMAVVALLVVLGMLVTQRDDTDTAGSPSRESSGQATPSGQTEPSPTTTEPAPDLAQPDAAEMEQFVRDYLRTASSDANAGFERLTPAFQDASGGRSGYSGFWDDVSQARLDSVTADPESLTVTYTYSYVHSERGPQTDTVVLQLAFDAASGTYLIAGESA